MENELRKRVNKVLGEDVTGYPMLADELDWINKLLLKECKHGLISDEVIASVIINNALRNGALRGNLIMRKIMSY